MWTQWAEGQKPTRVMEVASLCSPLAREGAEGLAFSFSPLLPLSIRSSAISILDLQGPAVEKGQAVGNALRESLTSAAEHVQSVTSPQEIRRDFRRCCRGLGRLFPSVRHAAESLIHTASYDPPSILRGRYCYAYFTDVETEASGAGWLPQCLQL